MKEHDRFIETFKSIEGVIRELYPNNPEASFKWFEDQQTDSEYANKLRLCRYIRNFIQHNKGYETFIHISPEMQTFMDNLLVDVKAKKGTVWDISSSIGRCFYAVEDAYIYDVVEGMAKKNLDSCLVLKKDGTLAGIFTAKSICKAITSGKQLKKIKLNSLEGLYSIPKKLIYFVTKNTEQEIVLQYFKDGALTVLVTDNGKQDGKVLGIAKNPY